MATTVINSFNIFIDSGRCISSQSKGDDMHLSLGEMGGISCADNQFLRLTLQDFNMVKNSTNVNRHNNTFRVIINNNLVTDSSGAPSALDNRNFKNIHDVAYNFANKFMAAVIQEVGGGITGAVSELTPASNDNVHGNTDNIISFKVTFSATVPHTPIIQFHIDDGDSYELLGGDKITKELEILGLGNTILNNQRPSINVVASTTTNNNDTLTVTCKYPAQRFTEEHIYLRTDLPSTNLQTESYASQNDDSRSNHIGPSRILGKIPISSSVCQFHTETGNEYTINLKQKNFTMMRLHLTDSHGRTLPYVDGAVTRGNFNFKCTIKVDTMQHLGQQNNQLQTDHPQKSVSARFGSTPLEYLDYGGVRTNR